MTKKEKGFDALFEEKVNIKNGNSDKHKPTTISIYVRYDYAEKLKIISFYKRKKGVSNYLQSLIKKEIEKHSDIFQQALDIYKEENKNCKKELKDLGIL